VNQRVLKQKARLLLTLASKCGEDEAHAMYQAVCPITKTSIGHHMRHSLDHIERAINSALKEEKRHIRYDVRERAGGEDERDFESACDRIMKLDQLLGSFDEKTEEEQDAIMLEPVEAYFMLGGDYEVEYPLTSTAMRELGFAAHHAVHHMLIVRLIILSSPMVGLEEADLPPDFGSAPTPPQYDNYECAIPNPPTGNEGKNNSG
jgi:hypothetical protein